MIEASDLRADCANCFGLCCVAPAFARSADFAIDKPAGRPCPHLGSDDRCGIHSRLRSSGFRGCAVYDCFGAGQKISQVTFAGVDPRADPGRAARMVQVLPVMRLLQELLRYLTEALALVEARTGAPAGSAGGAAGLAADLRRALDRTGELTRGTPDELLGLDAEGHRGDVNQLLRSASALVRGDRRPAGRGGTRAGRDLAGADLVAADLVGADLRAASLRGACLIGADLRRADLRLADLTGADLRDTDLRGADLSTSLFLTRPQLRAARGDAGTRLPPWLERPAHW